MHRALLSQVAQVSLTLFHYFYHLLTRLVGCNLSAEAEGLEFLVQIGSILLGARTGTNLRGWVESLVADDDKEPTPLVFHVVYKHVVVTWFSVSRHCGWRG